MYYHMYLYHGNKYTYHCVITQTLQNGQTLGQFFELLYAMPYDLISWHWYHDSSSNVAMCALSSQQLWCFHIVNLIIVEDIQVRLVLFTSHSFNYFFLFGTTYLIWKSTITVFCIRLPREWEGLRNRASPSRHMVGKADWENSWQDCKHTIYTSRPSIV